MQKLYSIQSLRALAAMTVFVFHFIGHSFIIGAAGVDVFFVISGLIMGAYARHMPPGTFIYHRLVRIVPLYWAVTIAMCIGAMFGLFRNFTFTIEALIKSLLFIPYLNDAGQAMPLLVVGWTLNAEMLFYLIFMVGLMLRVPLLFTSIVLLALVAFGQWFGGGSAFVNIWASPLLVEFVAGLLLSQVMTMGRLAGITALLLSAIGFIFAFMMPEPLGLTRLIVWGLPSFLLVAGCLWLETAGAWPKRALRGFEAIGDASYALYLLHGLVVSLVLKFFFEDGLLAWAVIVPLGLLVAFIAHYLFEKPILRLAKRWR